jgi:cyclohexanone monooxygenase
MCVDTGYYEAFNRDNVHLVSVKDTPIDEITQNGVRIGDSELPFDILVFGSGFDAMTGALLRIDLRGRSGETLQERWAEGPRTYLGLAVAGFPNLFMVTGPGSPSVLSNMMVSIEQHVDLIADCIAYVRERGLATAEPTPKAEQRWVDHVRELGEASLYPRAASANSWYMGANVPGKPRVLLPYVGGVGAYRKECDEIVKRGWEGFVFRAPAARLARVQPRAEQQAPARQSPARAQARRA